MVSVPSSPLVLLVLTAFVSFGSHRERGRSLLIPTSTDTMCTMSMASRTTIARASRGPSAPCDGPKFFNFFSASKKKPGALKNFARALRALAKGAVGTCRLFSPIVAQESKTWTSYQLKTES